MIRQIPIHFIYGKLGAGKTSLLIQAGELFQERLAFIINDFGPVEFNAYFYHKMRESQRHELYSLEGGCLCCTSLSQLKLSLLNILATQSAERVFVEVSGLVEPARLFQDIIQTDLLNGCQLMAPVFVLDARLVFEPEYYRNFLCEDQIRLAQVIVVNFLDQLEDSQTQEVLHWLSGIKSQSTQVVLSSESHVKASDLSVPCQIDVLKTAVAQVMEARKLKFRKALDVPSVRMVKVDFEPNETVFLSTLKEIHTLWSQSPPLGLLRAKGYLRTPQGYYDLQISLGGGRLEMRWTPVPHLTADRGQLRFVFEGDRELLGPIEKGSSDFVAPPWSSATTTPSSSRLESDPFSTGPLANEIKNLFLGSTQHKSMPRPSLTE